MQCLNIRHPAGQGLWSGQRPSSPGTQLCGEINNVRRIYYWAITTMIPKQIFKSSVSYTQCMETALGDLPVFLAYQLNGQELSLKRGGPAVIIVPVYGYKSIKWLSHIFLTMTCALAIPMRRIMTEIHS